VSPFDWRSVLLARHAQHVVLIHFPIALFIAGVAFDAVGYWLQRERLAQAAYYNFCAAAILSLPALATGLIAWQWALEGQRLKGTLLQHLLAAVGSSLVIATVWLLEWRARLVNAFPVSPGLKFGLEILGVCLLALTGHLGGFLSGVNGGP
jgi:uncharacterized membrane protein